MNPSKKTRRAFLQSLAVASGAAVLMPLVSACAGTEKKPEVDPNATGTRITDGMPEVPMVRPDDWDPIAFNKARGNAGAIPDTYLTDINGPDGVKKHLGKHLPYIPKLDVEMVAGILPIMWGDPEKGYTKHPNAPTTAEKPEGHWYNWISLRKAVEGEALEVRNEYPDWPGDPSTIGDIYAVQGGGEISAEKGKNTIYLAALPKDVVSGDTVRIYAHCLTHGEYVDFLQVP